MKIITLLFILSCTAVQVHGQGSAHAEVVSILDKQAKAWNKGDLDQFMVGYWESDSLMYIGKTGVTYGYRSTLERYKKNYNSREKMGTLKFTILHVKELSPEYVQVVGKYELTRTVGDASGHFTLLFRRIGDSWVIISDHSS